MTGVDAYDVVVALAFVGLVALGVVRSGAWWFDAQLWRIRRETAERWRRYYRRQYLITRVTRAFQVPPALIVSGCPAGTVQNPANPSPRPRP